MRTIKDPEDILLYLPNQKRIVERIDEAKEAISLGHKFAVTDFYLTRVLDRDPDHPLLSAVLPSMDDLNVFLGLHVSVSEMKVSGSEFMIQKYKPNSILTLTTACAQACTYCFRKQHESKIMSADEIDDVLADIENTDNGYLEMILSGGDPLMLPVHLLEHLAGELNSIRKKRTLLVGMNTRIPVVAPYLCYGSRMDALHELKLNNIGLHILHPDEITDEFVDVCYRIRERHPVNFRTTHPLLRGINDDPGLLVEMYMQLADEINASPKDLIVPIPTGTGPSKRLGLERCMEIMRDLHDRLPGNLLPRLIVCSPVYGKSYIDPFHTKTDGSFGYDVNPDDSYDGMYIKDGSCMQRCKAID